jgi:hypothetical protein
LISFFFNFIFLLGFGIVQFVDEFLWQEYNVRASSANDKNYFIGRFMTGLPDFSKKKSAENKWSLQKDGLKSRQVTDSMRVLKILNCIIDLYLWLYCIYF